MLPSPSFDDIRTGHDDTILAGYGRYQRYHCPALTTSFLLIRSAGKTCETNRFGPMKFHYCDKVGYRLSLVVVRRTGQAKTHASKRNPHHSPRSATGCPLFLISSTFLQLFQQPWDSGHSSKQHGRNCNSEKRTKGCDVSPKAQPGKSRAGLVSHKGRLL